MSRYVEPSGPDQRSTNSWVRDRSRSSKTSRMRLNCRGSAKRSRSVCSPGSAARQPPEASGWSADSIGWSASSEESSTSARCSRSSHGATEAATPPETGPTIRLRIFHPPLPNGRETCSNLRLPAFRERDDASAQPPVPDQHRRCNDLEEPGHPAELAEG